MKGSENVLDFLDKDLEYAPINLFGLRLEPGLLKTLATLVLSVVVSYV